MRLIGDCTGVLEHDAIIVYLGLAKTIYIHTYIRCIYDIVSRGMTIHAVIYGVHIQFWPTLSILAEHVDSDAVGWIGDPSKIYWLE
jgi:hypothetical protein